MLRLLRSRRLCIGSPVKFGGIVKKVKEIGFNPSKSRFVEAIRVLASLSKSKRDQKVEVYKRWGWSNKNMTTAFKKFPFCMAYSEDKIMGTMDFYVNKLGLDSSVVLHRPVLLSYKLEEEADSERCSYSVSVLQRSGYSVSVKLDSRITNMLECTDKCLLEKFENCFKEEAPHLIKMYNEKLNEAMSERKIKS